ncbi:hypothetical protein AGMMS50212_11650 [Spirochaetia bacterium]|nr:hypothetical protein AGMMS50212_11650 [Spirochaetia bacterium]
MVAVKRIEICGNIASGKSTIAKAFGAAGYNCVFENFDGIASLSDFYADPKRFAFETEIAFTIQHYYQIKKITGDNTITDFSLINDYAFALTTLNAGEFSIYKKLFFYLIKQIGAPKEIIWIDEVPAEGLRGRIENRNRSIENAISLDYLKRVQDNICKAQKIINNKAQKHIINTFEVDINAYTPNFLISLLKKSPEE